MARSHLMVQLRRMAARHAEAARLGVDVSALPPATDPSRRQILHGIAATAAAAALPRPLWATGGRKPSIAIIGAGIAGLSAALTLRDAGFACTIYEAANRVGGRMHSNTKTWTNGQKSEWCGEFIDSGHQTILGLAMRYGLTITDEIAAQPDGSSDTLFFLGERYSKAQANADFLPVFKKLSAQTDKAGSTSYNSVTPEGRRLDRLSVFNWIERYVPGGHAAPLGRFLDTAYNQEYGLDTTVQSSLNIVSALGAQPSPPPPFAIYGASDQRFSIEGGNQLLPKAIAADLAAGSPQVGCNLKWRLVRIARAGRGYALEFKTPEGRTTIRADEVILTVPFSVLRGLDYDDAGFDARKRTAIRQLGYGTNTKLSMQFTDRPWNRPDQFGQGDGNIYTDLFFQNAWDSSRGLPGPDGVLTLFTGGSNGASFVRAEQPYASAEEDKAVGVYARTLLTQVEKVWPGISNSWSGRATLGRAWADPNALGSYSCWKVGQYTAFAGYEGVRQGHCHFAGEHCSLNFQGYMEGGAQEGIRAAKEIIGG